MHYSIKLLEKVHKGNCNRIRFFESINNHERVEYYKRENNDLAEAILFLKAGNKNET